MGYIHMSAELQPEISIVIPLLNESENIEPLYSELSQALNLLGKTYEVIVIDDGSSDGSFDRLKKIHERDGRWRVIRFRRNFGQAAAFSAGFAAARGNYVITIDADLQNDPRDIKSLLEKADEGYDIVSGWRVNRKEPFLSRRLPSMLANSLISKVVGVALHDYGCSLKVYRGEVVKNVMLYGELHRFIPAIISSIGIRTTELPVNDRARRHGSSKYGIGRTFKVMLDLITVRFILQFSTRPLHFFGALGLGTASLGTVLGLYLVYAKLVLDQPIGTRPLLVLAVLLVILGVQAISTGLVAELVTRAYYEGSGKALYTIQEELGKEERVA